MCNYNYIYYCCSLSMDFGTSTLIYALLVIMMVSCVKSHPQSHCDTQDDCIVLFKNFRCALLSSSRHNLFHLQEVFYPSSGILPALVKVTYNLNLTCDSEFGESWPCNRSKDYMFGWTNRRLYMTFHPAVINLLRFQLPFWILNPFENADGNAFLWYGSDHLPSVKISLDLEIIHNSFTSNCPPGCEIILLALKELNYWVSF